MVTTLAALLGALTVGVAPASAAPAQDADDPYPRSAWELVGGGNSDGSSDEVYDHWETGNGDGWQDLWQGTGCTGRVGIRRVDEQWIEQTRRNNAADNSYRIRVQIKCPQDVEAKIRPLNQQKGLAEAPVISLQCHATLGEGDATATRSDWVMARTTRPTAEMYAKFRKTYPNNTDQRTQGVCAFVWLLPGLQEPQRTVTLRSPFLGGGADARDRRVSQPGDALNAEWVATQWSKEGADASGDAGKRNGWHDIDNGCIARVGIRRVSDDWYEENDSNWYRLRAQIKCQDYTGPDRGEVRTECQVIGGSPPSGQNWDVSTRWVSGADLEGLADGERRAAKKYRRTFLNSQDTAVSARCTFAWVNGDDIGDGTPIASPRMGGDRR